MGEFIPPQTEEELKGLLDVTYMTAVLDMTMTHLQKELKSQSAQEAADSMVTTKTESIAGILKSFNQRQVTANAEKGDIPNG